MYKRLNYNNNNNDPCGLGDQNSGNYVCPCACCKERLIKGYKLSYNTDLLYATPTYCMHDLLACSEAYEFGSLGTGLSWFR